MKKREEKSSVDIRMQKVCCLFVFCLLLIGCGIYTTEEAPDPPFGQYTLSDSLVFRARNEKDKLEGYNLWYRYTPESYYKLCNYKGENAYPTIPKLEEMEPGWAEYVVIFEDVNEREIEYTVYVAHLYPINSSTNFADLGNPVYFAVSSYGLNGVQSEKVEFVIWP